MTQAAVQSLDLDFGAGAAGAVGQAITQLISHAMVHVSALQLQGHTFPVGDDAELRLDA